MGRDRPQSFLDVASVTEVALGSVSHAFEFRAAVAAATGADTIVVEVSDGDLEFARLFAPGDTVRLGWSEGRLWRKGLACIATVSPDGRSVSLTAARPVDEDELRRATMRAQAFFALTCAFADGSEIVETRGRTLNVSTGGFAARMNRAIDVGTECAVLLEMRNEEPILSVARVVRQGSTGTLHMRFTQLGASDRNRLAATITSPRRATDASETAK